MIFDSIEMEKIRRKYQKMPQHEIPFIAVLDRNEEYLNERIKLERLISSVPKYKQQDWLHRLVNESEAQHIGSWFEMMLYGWLKTTYEIEVEPNILGCKPDFVVKHKNTKVAIEATSVLIKQEERQRIQKQNRIWFCLREIRRPYGARLIIHKTGKTIYTENLKIEVIKWLDSGISKPFRYIDDFGNDIELIEKRETHFDYFALWQSSEIIVNPLALNSPLKNKSNQHKNLRNSGLPYVIAVFVEPPEINARDVVDAWLGRPVIVVERKGGEIIKSTTDGKGLLYYKKTITHTSVSGTLVFKSNLIQKDKNRVIEGVYVENPYSLTPISPNFFQVNQKYVVVERGNSEIKMDWA